MNAPLSSLRELSRPPEDIYRDLSESRQFDPLYFLMLVMSCLIALLGLLVNSPAVIIGAMLISPLMGPILACGLALTLADWGLGRKSLRNVLLSVGEAVALASVATALSPLREVTPEILARTNPNLMDLLIACFSGLAGTLALTSRKGGLTIIPGVAIATAVMPPLATTGFGVATAQAGIAWGGFMLFFTNLTAIVISAAGVFFLVGFRPHEEADHLLVRYRTLIAAAVLVVVSIPLVRTLHSAAQQARLRREITSVLKRRLESEGRSRVSSVDFEAGPRDVSVDAVVHTSRFIPGQEEDLIESLLSERLGRPVTLDLMQLRLETQDFLASAQAKPVPATTPRPPPAAVVGDLQRRLLSSLGPLVGPVGVDAPVVRALGEEAGGGLLVEVEARAAAPSDASAWAVAAAALGREAGTPVRVRATVLVGDPAFIVFRTGALRPTPQEGTKLEALAYLARERADLRLDLAVGPEADAALFRPRLEWLRARVGGQLVVNVRREERVEPAAVRVQLAQDIDVTGLPPGAHDAGATQAARVP